MRRILLVALIAFLLGGLAVGGYLHWRSPASAPGAASMDVHAGHDTGEEPSPTRYRCPMHPNMISDTAGECPICTMRMVPIEEEAPAPPPARRKVIYRSTMNPNETSDRPGKDSMGMEMVPVEVDEATERPVAGYATITVPVHKQQSIGVKTARVERRALAASVESVGRVDYDETGLSWVNARVSGFIEVLHVDRTGQPVRRGQPLLEIYSPELVSTQEEYLVAVRNLGRLEASGAIPAAIEKARALVQGARRRLELWEIPDDQIRDLEERGSVSRRMTIRSPVSGYVVEKAALAGKSIAPGENLYRVADLARVWVLAEVYEYQAPLIRPGQEARIILSYVPGRTYQGRVDYVYPYLDPASRTLRVRIVVPNEDGTLRPEMFASVTFRVEDAGPVLAVPNEAILDTGERRIAFVKQDEGTFEPRELVVGQRTREYTAILEGLSEGEEIVTSGNFLIDSESRLKAALSGMAPAGGGHRHGD